jgi:hypothetical protein
MKKLVRIEMTEEEKGRIAAAVEAVGTVLERFEAANHATFDYTPEIRLTVQRKIDFDAPHPWPKKTEARWSLSMSAVGNAYAECLDGALDQLFGMTEATAKRALAAKHRKEAAKLDAEAKQLEVGQSVTHYTRMPGEIASELCGTATSYDQHSGNIEEVDCALCLRRLEEEGGAK